MQRLRRPVSLVVTLLVLLGLALGLGALQAQAPAPPTVSGETVELLTDLAVPGKEGASESNRLADMEAYWNNRVTYPTGRFNAGWVRQAAEQDRRVARAVPAGTATYNPKTSAGPLALSTTSFTALGPKPLQSNGCSGCYQYGLVSGRINAIVIDPVTPNVAYAGSDGGGVWKTTNCCTTATSWTVVTDDPLLATISVDALEIDPSNHNTIYAGTGDLNYGSFSMGSAGILKSTNAGATWTTIGASVFTPYYPEPSGKFPQYQAVGKVRVDPRNSNNLVAGAKNGLFFSYDAGTNWTGPCTTNAFSTQRQDTTGLILSNNGTSTTIYVAVGPRGFATPVQYDLDQNGANGIYKGTLPASGCPASWTLISTPSNGWPAGSGSGTPYGTGSGNPLGRLDMAIAPSNANYLYVQVQAIAPNSNSGCASAAGCQLGVWRTTDGGTTWAKLTGTDGNSLKNCSAGAGDYNQNWYDQAVAVDPNNPNRIFVDTNEIWLWTSGATTLKDLSCVYSGGTTVHADQHALTFVPGSSSVLLAGADGGVYLSTNANATTPTFTQINSGLNTIEFYSGDISANFATSSTQVANGGAQDNGAEIGTWSGTPGAVQWQMGKGGDGFYARIDPVGKRYWQGNNSGHLSRCTTNCGSAGASWTDRTGGWTGDVQQFALPYELFKGNPATPANDCKATVCDRIIVGTVRLWETITASATSPTWYVNSPANLTKQTLGNRSFITQLSYAQSLSTTVIVGTNDGNVQYGFGLGKGTNNSTWVNVTGGNTVLPNRPVLDVATSPTNPLIGYAAIGGFNENSPTTPGHVFQVTCTTNCASFTWADKTGNLPNIPVDSILANPKYPQQVFAGTDFGLYFTNDITVATPTWLRFQAGLPNVMIWDMQYDRGFTTLSVWTRSRGAYVWPLPTGPFTP